MGLRRVSELALPAFLSSAVGSTALQDALLARCPCPIDIFKEQFLSSWGSLFGQFPVGSEALKQSAWDLPGIKTDKLLISSSLQTPRERAVFLAASYPHSAAWLAALPGLRAEVG